MNISLFAFPSLLPSPATRQDKKGKFYRVLFETGVGKDWAHIRRKIIHNLQINGSKPVEVSMNNIYDYLQNELKAALNIWLKTKRQL